MAEDWAADVKKYAPGADDGVIADIVRYCGIALRTRDASLVSFADPAETARVRDNYLKKKLGLTQPDADLDAAIAAVGQRMRGDSSKNRVTVYYLLAEQFGLLHLFGKGEALGTTAGDGDETTGGTGAALAAAGLGVAGLGAAAAGTSAAANDAPAARVAATPAAPTAATTNPAPVTGGYGERGKGGGMPWWLWALLGLVLLGLIWWFFLRPHPTEPAATAPVAAVEQPSAPASPASGATDLAAAPAEGSVTIPAGAGVTAELRDGKPVVKVYFDSGKAVIVDAFGATAGGLKSWLDSHPGSSLAVSGYNDMTGNAAANAELSKERAQAVKAALVATGIADTAVELVKPAETTDTTTDNASARRVEVVVR